MPQQKGSAPNWVIKTTKPAPENGARAGTEVRSGKTAEATIEQRVQNAKHAWTVERAQLVRQHEVITQIPNPTFSRLRPSPATASHLPPPGTGDALSF